MVLGCKGQGAIEYLLIIGAAIIVVAVVIVAITSVSNTGRDQLDDAGVSHTIDPLKEASGNYFRISNYYYPKSELGSGLVGLWHFDEGTGNTTTSDSSGKGNTGTLTNGPVFGGGRFGGALSFDGLNDYVLVPASSSLNIPGDITIEAWVYPQSPQPATHVGIVVGRGAGYGAEDYAMVLANYTSLAFNYYTNSGGWYYVVSAGTIPANQWTQIVVTRNISGNKMNYYANGSLLQTGGTIGAGNEYGKNSPKIIGADFIFSNSSYFNGKIDEVAIWNRALSDAEIQSLYANSQ